MLHLYWIISLWFFVAALDKWLDVCGGVTRLLLQAIRTGPQDFCLQQMKLLSCRAG